MPHFDAEFIEMIRSHPDTEVDGGATESAIDAAQSAAGFRFPASYTEFLAQFNGGAVSHIRLFGVGRRDTLDLLTQFKEMAEVMPAIKQGNMFPFANTWGGSYYCFDLAHHGTGFPKDPSTDELPIYFWDHEFSEEPADEPYVWSNLDSSFSEFIRCLYE